MDESIREGDAARTGRLWSGLSVAVFAPPVMAAATVGTLLLYHYEFPAAKLPVRAGFPLAVLSAAFASFAAASGVRIARGPVIWSAVAAVGGFAAYAILTFAGFLVVWFIAYDRNH